MIVTNDIILVVGLSPVRSRPPSRNQRIGLCTTYSVMLMFVRYDDHGKVRLIVRSRLHPSFQTKNREHSKECIVH